MTSHDPYTSHSIRQQLQLSWQPWSEWEAARFVHKDKNTMAKKTNIQQKSGGESERSLPETLGVGSAGDKGRVGHVLGKLV